MVYAHICPFIMIPLGRTGALYITAARQLIKLVKMVVNQSERSHAGTSMPVAIRIDGQVSLITSKRL